MVCVFFFFVSYNMRIIYQAYIFFSPQVYLVKGAISFPAPPPPPLPYLSLHPLGEVNWLGGWLIPTGALPLPASIIFSFFFN